MAFSDAYYKAASVENTREALRQQADTRNQELARLGYSFDANGNMSVRDDSQAQAEQLQGQQAAQLAKTLQAKLAAQDTDQALEDYAHTGDANYLQKALSSNPYLQQAWGKRGVQLVSNIDFNNDSKLLANSGVQPTAYDTPDKQSIVSKNLYKYYDGKDWNLGLLNNVAAETGALNRLGQRRGDIITKNTQDFRDLLNGPKASPYNADGHKYQQEIMAAADDTGLNPDIIASVIAKESSGKPNAVSPKGAAGLMQVMPDAANEVGVSDISSPANNILAGARYLKKQIDNHGGDLPTALAAYNAGPGAVAKYGGIPPYAETQNYVNDVMANIDRSQQYYGQRADTILDSMRAQANAAKGTTNQLVDTEQAMKGIQLQNDIIKTGQANRALDQKDRDLDLDLRKQNIDLRGQDIKLQTEGKTTTQKDLDDAKRTTSDMVDAFGGDSQFFNTDFSDPKTYREAYPYINRIEKLEGTTLSEADKKNIGEIRQLIALGDPAKNLTEEDTGLLDNKLSSARRYISENIKGEQARSAYYTFRNSVRKALSGQALTESEITSFNEAFGTLGNKLGPVLEQLNTSLNQVKANLDSTANLMNPYSAKVRLGADQDKLNKIQAAIDQRISYISGVAKPNTQAGKDAARKAFEE